MPAAGGCAAGRRRAWLAWQALLVAAWLPWLRTSGGFRMSGDIWPIVDPAKRQGLPATVQEAFEEYQVDAERVTKFKALGPMDKGVHCAGYDDLKRITFRRVQEWVRTKGIAKTFNAWDGIDDSIPDQMLNWRELRMGLRSMDLYDPFGASVELSVSEVEMLVRELTDDDTLEFVQSQWGSTFYKTDGSSVASITKHYRGQPRTLMDGGPDNAMCFSETGQDLGICGFVRLDNFTATINQVADMKYSENCNGHGVCDFSVGICHCHAGWSGFNCSEPEKPCSGVKTLKQSFGSISDGFGLGRIYGHNSNCTWIIEPEHHDTYGLPLVFTFVFLDMEASFDRVELYEVPHQDIDYKIKAFGVGGTFPKDRWAMPHSVVIGNGKRPALAWVTDQANPTGIYYGFKVLFGRLDSVYIKALSFPALAPGCVRQMAETTGRCVDSLCTNCGVTLDEAADDAEFQGDAENMCYSAEQASNATNFKIAQDYYLCRDTLNDMWLTHTADNPVVMRLPCPRGMMTLPDTFVYDMPEYVVGSGTPEVKVPIVQEGQAWQRGFIPIDWWAGCSFQCNNFRKSKRFDTIFEDIPGRPGPIFVAQITTKETSRAHKFQVPMVTYPKSRVTGIQYGHDPAAIDNRTKDEKNSAALRDLFNPVFKRFTSDTKGNVDLIELGKEYCEFSFTPTIPGIYQVNFFEMRKDMYMDKMVQAIPFPEGMNHRTAVVMPGRTSPGHSKAYGKGLSYFQTTRAGIGVAFRIDSFDASDNLRLVGGDQYIVALVHIDQVGQSYGEVSNLGNGSYDVVYNVTLSGRYTLSVTVPSLPGLCPNPRRVSLTTPGVEGKEQVRQMQGQRCDLGTDFTVMKNNSDGGPPIQWCTKTTKAAKMAREENCVEYSYRQTGFPWIPYKSPFSVWVDSGQIGVETIKAFGSGLSVAIAHFPTFFMVRIRDVFGNWASSLENITTAFDIPGVDQSMATGSTTPTIAAVLYAGDEVFQGDYFSEWQPVIAGEHRISVMLCNPVCVHIIGSPFKTKVFPAPSYGPNSTATGIGIVDGFAGHARSFTIQDRDSALNKRTTGGEDFVVSLKGLSLADCPLIQDQVLLDVMRKCPHLYRATMSPCTLGELMDQDLQGPEVSLNIQPSLSCMYRRNTANCTKGCCPDGQTDGCSEFEQTNVRSGRSPRSAGCAVRQCGFPPACKFAMKTMQQRGEGGHQDLIKTFIETAYYRCPQIERLGLEANILWPPDHRRDGQFNLIIPHLDPTRPAWRGPMSLFEIQRWIDSHDIRRLYYMKTLNSLGEPYYGSYGNATGHKDFIEGFVHEIASAQGRRERRTSTGPVGASLDPSAPNAIGNISLIDNDDGTYHVTFNITRAGLYSMSVMHSGYDLNLSPYEFIIRPEVFDPPKCICNGTGASKDKNTHSGESDYKGIMIAGKMVDFDISLRDQYWNYIWVSKPESDFRIYLDPMRIRYYDTTDRVEKLLYWTASFQTYTFHDFGDANYKVDYRITTAGTFPLNIRLKSPAGSYAHLDRSPYMIQVRPDRVDIAASTAFGGGLTLCGAGLICTFGVETRDSWGNRRVLQEDEGPYCHTWNANINNGGSGGNQWRTIFPSNGCTAGEDCARTWMVWANTMPASGYSVDGPEEPQDFPAYNNEVAYHARGGLLHDCIPTPPFENEEEYNKRPTCSTTRQGPCGRFDEWGRVEKPIFKGDDGNMYGWTQYRAKYPDKRPRYTAFIDDAQPVKYQRFDVFIDSDNMYSANYNLTREGIFKLSVVYINPVSGIIQHIRGSPFRLQVTGGLTDPLKSSAVGQGLETAVVGYPATLTVFARDRFENKRTLGREAVQVFIQPTNFGLGRIPALVHDRLDGSYYVEYNATISGKYMMSVSLLEQDIPGSPFTIQVQKGFNFPHFNTSWGLNFAGSAYLKPEQGHVFCWGGNTGCVSQIRLNLNEKDSVGAVWYDTMQKVSNGFEMRFSFRITDLSRHCKTDVILEDRCMGRGGDGFAFVIHDNGFSRALGAGASSMGYGGIDNSIAFEFDTWYNSELGDIYQNHVAVHTMGTEKNNPSSRSRLVSTTDVPDLADGNVHTVRMRYEPWMNADSLLDPSYLIGQNSLGWIASGAGTLKLWIDDLDRPILTFPLNLGNILALTEGRAWLGFTASTGLAMQNHYIHSWSYVDTVCLNDCNNRGDCIDGNCYCEDQFSGEDCRIGAVEKQQKDLFLCPTQNQKLDSSIAASNCSCPAGSYGPIGGPCDPCPIDTWKSAAGDSACIACPPNSDSGNKAAVQDRADCQCKAGYVGTDGGPCYPVPEDTYKIAVGNYKDATKPCPPNSGTLFRQARSNVLDCLCKPGYQGPNGGPCLVCPTESWKSSWGDASCESQCPPFSETFGCDGPGGNTGCISSWQCVCKAGYTGQRCLLESPQNVAGKTCPPCVRTKYGPMDTKYDYDPIRNPLYDPYREKSYTIPLADFRANVPEPKRPPPEYGTDGQPGDTLENLY